MWGAALVAGMRPGGAMIAERSAAFVTRMVAVGVMLGLRQPRAYPGTAFEMGVEGIEGVGADLAGPGVAEDRPDDAPDVASCVASVDSARSVTSRYLSRTRPKVASRLGTWWLCACLSSLASAAV